MVALVFERLGVQFEARDNDVFVPAGQSLTIVPDIGGAVPAIKDAPWPGFPAASRTLPGRAFPLT